MGRLGFLLKLHFRDWGSGGRFGSCDSAHGRWRSTGFTAAQKGEKSFIPLNSTRNLIPYGQSANQEVKYDMQIFADRIEFCWIHLRGIAALENSLWAFDGKGIRVWLNALAIETPTTQDQNEIQESVKESVNIPLEFYPLCMLLIRCP